MKTRGLWQAAAEARQRPPGRYNARGGRFCLGCSMTYLAPYFDYDVFVSYSHDDPRGKGDSPLKRWTHALIEKPDGEIRALEPEFKDLHLGPIG